MSGRGRKKKRSSRRGVVSEPASARAVEEALSRGDARLAMEAAKALARASNDPAVESLLGQAYAARIVELRSAGLEREASSLADVARKRCPAVAPAISVALETDVEETWSFPLEDADVERLLSRLVEIDPDPSLPADAEASEILRLGLVDPRAVAFSEALPSSHPLREQARIVTRALVSACGDGFIEDDEALAAIPDESPLGPWAAFVRALDALQEGHHVPELLSSIPEASALAPARELLEARLGPPGTRCPATSGAGRRLWKHLFRVSARDRWRDLLSSLEAYEGDDPELVERLQAYLASGVVRPVTLRRQAVRGVMFTMVRRNVYFPEIERILDEAMGRALGRKGVVLTDLDRIWIVSLLEPMAATDRLLEVLDAWSKELTRAEQVSLLACMASRVEDRVWPERVGVADPSLEPALQEQMLDRVVELLELALERGLESDLLEWLASIHEARGHEERLTKALERWQAEYPEDRDLLLRMAATALDEEEDLPRAIRWAERATAEHPGSVTARCFLVRASFLQAREHLLAGRVDEALARCEAARASLNQDAVAWIFRGFAAVARRLGEGGAETPSDAMEDIPRRFADYLLRRITLGLPEAMQKELGELAFYQPPRDEEDFQALDLLERFDQYLEGELAAPSEWRRSYPRWFARSGRLPADLLLSFCGTFAALEDPLTLFQVTRKALAYSEEEIDLGHVLMVRASCLGRTGQPDRVRECLCAAEPFLDRSSDATRELVRKALVDMRRGLPDEASDMMRPFSREEAVAVIRRERACRSREAPVQPVRPAWSGA